jgi:hypothetical protein
MVSKFGDLFHFGFGLSGFTGLRPEAIDETL